jgi:hypothetical protein
MHITSKLEAAANFLRGNLAKAWKVTLILTVLACSTALAQNLTGEIDGTVRDSSGAAIPNASITIRNTDQNLVVRTVRSDQQGQFTVPLLAVGHYSLSATAVGFQTATVNGIDVHVNQSVLIPITLALGPISQTVNVTAESIGVQLESPAAGTLVNNTQMTQQSLSSRNFLQLLNLQPGVTGNIPGPQDRGAIASSGVVNAANYSVNGLPPAQNGFFVDGEDMQRRSAGGSQIAAYPGLDFIQEMDLQRSNFGAQYGGSGSAFVSIETKSGSSSFHGSAFEFFRSQILNANSFFNNLAGIPRPGSRYNDFGYSLGGPVWIPYLTHRNTSRTFFFFGQEYLRSESLTQETLTNIPTAAQRHGIFDTPVCVAYNAAGKCTSSATAITRIDPTAQAYLTDIIDKTPLPNNPNDPQGLIAAESGINNETQTIIRIDHQFTDKLSVFFRYLDDPFQLVVPNGLRQTTGIPGVGTSRVTDGATIFLGHATYIVNSNNVLDGGFAHMQNWVTALPTGLIAQANSPDIRPVLPFVSTLNRVPNLNINGSTYAAIGPYDNRDPLTQVFVNDTSTLGRHTLRVGVNIELQQAGNNFGQTNAGAFTFSASAIPPGSHATPFEQAFANFLLGQVTTFQQDSSDTAVLPHTNLYEAYFQDTVHLSSRLTVDAGVRYSYIAQPTSGVLPGYPFIPLVNFVPTLYVPSEAPTISALGAICTRAPCSGTAVPNPNYNPLNGLIIGGKNSPFGDKVTAQPTLTFAPRFGFAYDMFGNGHTALRGGYGIYYLLTPNAAYQQMATRNPPNVTSLIISNTSFDDPGGGGTVSSFPVTLQAAQPNARTPYVQMWSLDLQQQLNRSLLVDIGYYGNHGVHEAQSEDMNQIPPGMYVQAGIIPGNIVTPSNTQILNQIRPYVGYGPLNSLQNAFSSNYNALQVSLQKHISGGALVTINYTYSKALSNGDGSPQDIYNLHSNYGPTGFDRTNVFTAYFIYHLPFFRAQQGWLEHLLGGWETTGIVTYGSGFFLTPHTINVDPAGLGILVTGSSAAGTGTPDALSNPNIGAPHTLRQWFNTNAFAPVPPGQYRVGNAGIGDIKGPGYENWDLSLFKNFRLKESLNFQLRGESFNTFNHTNFAGVGTTLGQTNYGQIISTGPARVIQLAAKLMF